jgi:hypothetical protein
MLRQPHKSGAQRQSSQFQPETVSKTSESLAAQGAAREKKNIQAQRKALKNRIRQIPAFTQSMLLAGQTVSDDFISQRLATRLSKGTLRRRRGSCAGHSDGHRSF